MGRHALITLAASIPVATVYLPQPLLPLFRADFGVGAAELGIAAGAMPTGFALGALTLIPLSDRVQARSLGQIQAAAAGVLLLLAAMSRGFPLLCVALALAGFAAAFAQTLTPVAIRLAPAARAGTAAATLAGAFLVAIFGIRVGGAWAADAIGWRPVLAVGAVMLLALVPVIRISVPVSTDLQTGRSYLALLAGLPRLAAKNPIVVELAAAQACLFFAFQALWSVVSLHFTAPPFEWAISQAGLIGIVGVAAGLLALVTGRLVDRLGALRATTTSAGVGLIAASAIAIAPMSVTIVGLGLLLLCVALQTSQAGSQSRAVRSVAAHNAGGANTIYVSCMFVGGSLGAGSAAWLFEIGGIGAVALSSIPLLLGSLVLMTVLTRRDHSTPGSTDGSVQPPAEPV